MYLHLGQSTVIRGDDIIGIFDLDKATVSKVTRDFLSESEKKGRTVTVSYELPKSFTVCSSAGGDDQKIYISQLNTQTLEKRSLSAFNKV